MALSSLGNEKTVSGRSGHNEMCRQRVEEGSDCRFLEKEGKRASLNYERSVYVFYSFHSSVGIQTRSSKFTTEVDSSAFKWKS